MRRTNTIHIKVVKGLKEESFLSLYRLFSTNSYQDEKGFGFTSTDIEGKILASTLIQKRISHNQVFDIESQLFQRQEITVFDTIPLVVDLQHRTLEIFSGASLVNRTIAIINRLLSFDFRIDDFPVSPPLAWDRLKQAGYSPNLQRIVIDNFAALPGISGRYNAAVSENSNGSRLIENQRKDVRQISFYLDLKIEENIEVTLNGNGGWKLRCDEDHTTDVIAMLLELFLQGDENG